MKRSVLIFFAIALICGCQRDFSEEQILAFDTPLMTSGGQEVLRYDENSCQIGFNRERCEFRVMKDNLSDFFRVSLESLSFKTGEEIRGSVFWSEPENIRSKKDITLNVLKIENDMIWLKSDRERIGLVLRTLE